MMHQVWDLISGQLLHTVSIDKAFRLFFLMFEIGKWPVLLVTPKPLDSRLVLCMVSLFLSEFGHWFRKSKACGI